MKFRIGDKVVYPNQGVAVIRDRVTRKIGGVRGQYYVLKIHSQNSTVMVPEDNIDAIGLRKISTKKQLEQLFEALKHGEFEMHSDWKRRYQQNAEKMQSGTLEEIGEVVRGLYCLSQEKNLGLRDQKMVDSARSLIVSEIAAVKDITEEEATELVDSLLQPPVAQD